MEYAIFNGKLIDGSEAKISITDKGYFFDFAVYSSLKVIQGKIFFPKHHIDRLFKSAELIDLGHAFSKDEVMKWLKLVVDKNKIKDALLRIVLIGDVENNENAKLYIFPVTGVTYYPDAFYKTGVKVVTYRGTRRIPQAKTKDMLLGFLAFREAGRQGAVDALLVDYEGNIREGTQSNFFAIKDNTIVTPPKEKVLGGITKKMISKVSRGRFRMREEDIPLSKIREYDEFFIASTTKNVMPINQIDGDTFQSDFEKTKLIQKLFREYYHKQVLGK